MNGAGNHGLGFFPGKRTSAHPSKNEFVQEVAGLLRTISVTRAKVLVFRHRWEVREFRLHAAAKPKKRRGNRGAGGQNLSRGSTLWKPEDS